MCRPPGHVWEYFTDYAWAEYDGGPATFYRPLFILWTRLNFILCGLSPWGWHLLSIAKHAVVAVLLGLLVWRLLRDRFAALIAATLFALHPAQVESVAWVTVPDPLMSAGVLCTLLLYFRYVKGLPESSSQGKKVAQGSPENEGYSAFRALVSGLRGGLSCDPVREGDSHLIAAL